MNQSALRDLIYSNNVEHVIAWLQERAEHERQSIESVPSDHLHEVQVRLLLIADMIRILRKVSPDE